MERWLSLDEASAELRCSHHAIKHLIASKQIAAVRLSDGEYRILDPSPALRRNLLQPTFDRLPFLSLREVSQVLGLTVDTVKWYARHDRLRFIHIPGGPHYKVVTVGELRRFLAEYEKRAGPGKKTYSQVIVRWLRKYMADDLTPNGGVLAHLLENAVPVPEPQKAVILISLWKHFDAIEGILREIKTIKAGIEIPATQLTGTNLAKTCPDSAQLDSPSQCRPKQNRAQST